MQGVSEGRRVGALWDEEVALTAIERGMPEVSLLMYRAHCSWRKSQLSCSEEE